MMSAVCCAATPSNAMSNPTLGLTSRHNLSRMANHHNYYAGMNMDKLLLPQASSYSSAHLQTALQSWNSSSTINNNRSNAAMSTIRCGQGQAEGSYLSNCNRPKVSATGQGNIPEEHMSAKHRQHFNLINNGQSSQHWSQHVQGNVNGSSSHNNLTVEGLSMTAASSSRGSSSLSMPTSSSVSASSTPTSSAWQLTLASMSSDATYNASRRLAAPSSLFQSGQAYNQVNNSVDANATTFIANNGASIASRPSPAEAAGRAQSTNRGGLLSNSLNIRHRRTCSETFLVPDACLASNLPRSRRLQSNHKRLEEALAEAIPSASSGRVSQRIAQLQQSLYACSSNSGGASSHLVAVAPIASSSRVGHSLPVARPMSIDPKKDYSSPLSVDCSIEYDLPRVARPPAGAQPLLLIARRTAPSTSSGQSAGWSRLQQRAPNYSNYAFQANHFNGHTIRLENNAMTNPANRPADESLIVSGTNVSSSQVLQQQPLSLRLNRSTCNSLGANNNATMSGMTHEPAPVSSSSSDSGRGTDSERNSPGSAFGGPALFNSRNSSHKQSNLVPSNGHQFTWNHQMPAPPTDSGVALDTSSSWMAASHPAMRPLAVNRSLAAAKPPVRASSTSSSASLSLHHGRGQQSAPHVARLASGE